VAKNRKRHLDFDLNLLPFISVLAVCISFLLLVSVWTKVGTFNTNQAFGTDGADTAKNPESLWAKFDNDGSLRLVVNNGKDIVSKGLPDYKIAHNNLAAIDKYAREIHARMPQITMALVLPAADSSYEDIIFVMDRLKKENFTQVGIAPL
jgi:biopolymer transport protein TolR